MEINRFPIRIITRIEGTAISIEFVTENKLEGLLGIGVGFLCVCTLGGV